MKAAVYTRYGPPDVVQIMDVEKPVPKDDEVSIKVRAAAVNPLDWRILKGAPSVVRLLFGLHKPTVARPGRPGRDLAGQVEAVGRNVTLFRPGDEVFGASVGGTFAEYVCADQKKLARKPANITFEQAAAVPVAGITALQGLRDIGKVQPGQKVLINGAAGGVGTFAVQIAKSLGAEVTGVCSTRNVEMVRALGADEVIDYTREDFTNSGHLYDVMLDCMGNHPFSAYRRVLTRKGICAIAGGPKETWVILIRALQAPVLSRLVSQNFITFVARILHEDLNNLHELIKSEKVTPVVDRCYKLSEAAEALRYLEEGHARGKVVITLESDNKT